MIKLSRDSRLVRFAYLFGDRVPSQTNLCRFFWRIVGSCLPFAWLLMVLAFYISALIMHTRDTAIVTVVVVVGIIAVVLSVRISDRARTRALERGLANEPTPPPSLARETWRAWKARVCPLIEIGREN
jgi:hypothetical protein